MENRDVISKEDYMDPACVLCDPQTGAWRMQSVPLERIAQKADEYCDKKDFAGAERHLKYWLSEAESLGDMRGKFSLLNEIMGFYRKQGRQEEAYRCAGEALELIEPLELSDTISAGACYVNCGTVYDSFGEPEKALEYFRQAERTFEKCRYKDLYKTGSLYNNMALSLADLSRYDEALEYYVKALRIMRELPGSELEQAITYLNMADSAAGKSGVYEETPEEIKNYLAAGMELLDSESLPRDGYYAFVCEKCAPGFYCYGFADEGAELERRAEEIYEEIRGEQS